MFLLGFQSSRTGSLVPATRFPPSFHGEVLAEVVAPGNRILGKFIGGPLKDNAPFQKEISPVYYLEGFTDVVVRDQKRNSVIVAQLLDDFLDVENGDGVDSTEGLIKHEEARIGAEGTRDGEAPFFSSRESKSRGPSNLGNAKTFEHFVAPGLALFPVEVASRLKNREEILLYAELPEDGFLLGQIAESMTCTLMHW